MDELACMDAVKPVVITAVKRFHRQRPELDLHELLSESTPLTLEAVRSFVPGRGMRLTTWVYKVVWRRLIANSRSPRWRDRFSASTSLTSDVAKNRSFDLDRLMMEVSGNARIAIRAALKIEQKMKTIKTLREEFAWERSLIAAVWDEIREALE